jgi:uncharacterized protein DUF5367
MRILRIGVLLWLIGAAAIRLAGQRLLHSGRPYATLILYLISFLLMALLAPRIFRRVGVQKDSWPAAATLLMLPTLLLDPFSCVFFTTIFSNVEPGAAGVFGGWMLICCAGVVVGIWGTPEVKSQAESGVKA